MERFIQSYSQAPQEIILDIDGWDAQAQVTRLRSTLIKTAAKVTVSVRRVLVELAAHCPFAREIQIIAQRLSSGSQLIFA